MNKLGEDIPAFRACWPMACLLHLGIKDMRLGKALPAWVNASFPKVLKAKYNLRPITALKRI